MALLRRSGQVNFLRVHDLKTGYGPGDDQIDGEMVAKIDSEPDHAFGTTLRDDDRLPSHEGMLALLRDGITHDLETTVDYDLGEGRSNGSLMRVELRRK